MAYKALYRTYRPTTFDEVAGQQHIVKTIKNALATGKIAHAYIFAGPRGTGKTTMAKIMAKALNCEEGIGHQCNLCRNCQAINDGSHPDVLEIDAASNNGVEDIRELIDKVKYGTFLGRYKVYIIDEAHMMTPSAWNALLKTLEEPPAHVIFIFATTEPHKILPTILSRCQRYDFSKVSNEDIKERIKIILDKEQITYNDAAVDLIISLADGGVRDALSMLDQVLAYSGNNLCVDDVLNIFALESKEEQVALIESIVKGDVNDVLNRLGRYIQRGTDIKRLTNDMLVILKDVLIYETSGNGRYLQTLKEDEVMKLSDLVPQEKAMEMISVLMTALVDYKNVTSINPLFEITLLKLASIGSKPSEKPIKAQEKPVVEPKAAPLFEEKKPAPVAAQPKQPEPEPQEQLEEFPEDAVANDTNVLYINGTQEEDHYFINDKLLVEITVISKRDFKNTMVTNWESIKRLAKHPKLGKMATLLATCRPVAVSQKVMIMEAEDPKQAEKMNLIINQKDIQNIIRTVFNRKMFVYTLSRVNSVKYQGMCRDLMQVGKLPKANTVEIDFVGD